MIILPFSGPIYCAPQSSWLLYGREAFPELHSTFCHGVGEVAQPPDLQLLQPRAYNEPSTLERPSGNNKTPGALPCLP